MLNASHWLRKFKNVCIYVFRYSSIETILMHLVEFWMSVSVNQIWTDVPCPGWGGFSYNLSKIFFSWSVVEISTQQWETKMNGWGRDWTDVCTKISFDLIFQLWLMLFRRLTLETHVVGFDSFANIFDVLVRNLEAVTPFLERNFAVAVRVAPMRRNYPCIYRKCDFMDHWAFDIPTNLSRKSPMQCSSGFRGAISGNNSDRLTILSLELSIWQNSHKIGTISGCLERRERLEAWGRNASIILILH